MVAIMYVGCIAFFADPMSVENVCKLLYVVCRVCSVTFNCRIHVSIRDRWERDRN